MFIPLLAGAVAVKDVDNVHVKDRTRYVTDMAGMLSPGAVARVDSLMADAWRQSSAEPVVVIVDNLDGEDIDDYATELFELWKPGKKDKDNGVIMLISRDDRKFVIRTGYGVEGVLPDALCWTILNQTMKPYFQEGDYDGGVVAAATDINRVLTEEEARAELMSAARMISSRSTLRCALFCWWLSGCITCVSLQGAGARTPPRLTICLRKAS